MEKSLWIGLHAQIVNPQSPDHGKAGIIVLEPTPNGLITIRLPDGTHTQSYPMGVQIVGGASSAPLPPLRIPVADLDPDTLVGITPCDDGSEGWVVMGVQPDPDEPGKEIVAPIGDEHGQIVYLDINDAAEVLRTGKVWKHDMGEDAPSDS